ncbi:hypothetical protein GCM10010218_52860 [Streptomyces mashuensis]|uniref:DUF2795 domain-containing protein n=1 Tax=Streptomyces mashuensis TaxID=33904 RepID=A0A919EFD3_9ACTN|nr:DUF2795 domain-containing protein [Streptomyces mashuensis]GHF64832.1 hypothetical protein GCM10010218_52860 [Streptomyces mashuensis]
MAKTNPIELQKCLKGMEYPASKDNLVQHAKSHGAKKDTLDALSAMPKKDYDSPAAVTKAALKEGKQ